MRRSDSGICTGGTLSAEEQHREAVALIYRFPSRMEVIDSYATICTATVACIHRLETGEGS